MAPNCATRPSKSRCRLIRFCASTKRTRCACDNYCQAEKKRTRQQASTSHTASGLREASWSAPALWRFGNPLDGITRFHHPRAMSKHGISWPHAPMHQLSENGTYFVTAGTYLKAHHFRGSDRLRVLHHGLLTVAQEYGWPGQCFRITITLSLTRRPMLPTFPTC